MALEDYTKAGLYPTVSETCYAHCMLVHLIIPSFLSFFSFIDGRRKVYKIRYEDKDWEEMDVMVVREHLVVELPLSDGVDDVSSCMLYVVVLWSYT